MFELTQKELKAQFDLASRYAVYQTNADEATEAKRHKVTCRIYEDAYLNNKQIVCLNRGFNCDVYPLEECHFVELDSVTIAMQAGNLLVLAHIEDAPKRDHAQYGRDILNGHTSACHIRGILECMGVSWREREWIAPQMFVKQLANGNILLTLTDNLEQIVTLEAGEGDENDDYVVAEWAQYLAMRSVV